MAVTGQENLSSGQSMASRPRPDSGALQLSVGSAVRALAMGAGAQYSVVRFGALGDGISNSTAAVQAAIDECAHRGGGTVVVPAGQFICGAIWLRSNITLHLEAGARLTGVEDVKAFPVRPNRWEGPLARLQHASLVNGEDLENVAITGRGTIDGNGSMWWDLYRADLLEHERPKLIRLINCRNVLIDGITATNSPMWTINTLACDNVTITRVTVTNPDHSPNTDGINPDSCSNVRIADCHIDVGDDCIAIKSGTEDDGRSQRKACENIVVSGCTMLRGHGGVVIGSEISGGVKNVAIGNCIFRGTDRGIRIKARRGRGAAVEDVCASNIIMDGVLCPIVVNLFYECGATDLRSISDASPHPVTAGTPCFRRLRFSQISARRVKYAALFVLGLPEMFVDDIVLDNISICMDEENQEAGQPAMSPLSPKLCRAGLRFRNSRDIKLRGVEIRGHLGPALALESANGVLIQNLSGSINQAAEVHLTDVTHLRGDNNIETKSATNGAIF